MPQEYCRTTQPSPDLEHFAIVASRAKQLSRTIKLTILMQYPRKIPTAIEAFERKNVREKRASAHGISLNPGGELGFDTAQEMLSQL